MRLQVSSERAYSSVGESARLISVRSVVRLYLGPPSDAVQDRSAHETANGAGAIAQLGERRPCTAEVIGSKPISSTTFASGVLPVPMADAVGTGEPPGSMLFENQARM